MKVKMREFVQGRDISGVRISDGQTVTVLGKDESYNVSDVLGKWLAENYKAELLPDVHYGAQAEPETRNDEEKHLEPQEIPVESTKRGKKK